MRSIKSKVAIETMALFLLIIVISNGFIYTLFKNILKVEILKKNQEIVSQYSILIENFLKDVELIGQNIIIDNDIQNFCSYTKESRDFYKVAQVIKKLNQLIAIKTYIHSAILFTENEAYWSKYPYDSYFKKELNNPYFSDILKENEKSLFTSIHNFSYQNAVESDIVTYMTNIYALKDPTKKIGKLLINIDMAYLEKILEPMVQNYNDFIIINDRNLIYHYSNNNKDTIASTEDEKESLWQSLLSQNRGTLDFKNGYITWNRINKFNWTTIVYSTEKSITFEANHILIFFIFFTPITIIASFVIIYIIINKTISPIEKLSNGLNEFSLGNMDAQVIIKTGDELEALSDKFNNMVVSINEYIEQKIQDEKIKRKFKFDMLMSKIYPHFLYNTLNSVIYMARRDGNKDIVSMVRSLILILHDSMSAHKQQIFDTLEKELQVVEAYCNIQNFRYKNKFKLNIVINNELYNGVIPKNILQPIIENSIFHGIAPVSGKGIIEIGAEREGERLNIYI